MDIFLELDDFPSVLMNVLEEDDELLNYFRQIPEKERERLVEYINDALTGDEARHRIDEVRKLMSHYPSFYKQ